MSYAKDRRNSFGEHDKGSRKTIPRNKRYRVRANRRREQLVLTQAEPDDVESELKRERPRQWSKLRDEPLPAVVAYKLRRRARTGVIDEEQAEAKIARLPRVSGD